MSITRGALSTVLKRAAECFGIAQSYQDAAGKTQHASEAAIRGVLNAFGVDASHDGAIADAIQARVEATRRQAMEPVSVLWTDKPQIIRLKTSTSENSYSCSLKNERGELVRSSCKVERTGQNGRTGVRISQPLKVGYYQLDVASDNGVESTTIIVAPRQCYGAADDRKRWGLFAPMYAVHSSESWGSGSFTDFAKFGRFVGESGGDIVGTLPLNATFLSSPFEPSPYSPASRLFWSEFFIDVTAIPELAASRTAKALIGSKDFSRKLEQLQHSSLVNYAEQMSLKRPALEALARSFFKNGGARRKKFDAFMRARPEVEDYARFRAAGEKRKSSWHTWSPGARQGRIAPSEVREADIQYHVYTQFIAQEQVEQLLESCAASGVSLYLDVPVGVNSDSYDVWRNQALFLQSVSCGAPPDIFFSKGQDWGFPPLNPIRLRESRYSYWRDVVAFQLRHAKTVRLDHIMGLHRLYCVPHGLPARDGAYVQYNAEDLYAILSVESHRHQSILIGENLGTVPPVVNQSMKRHGLRTMFILQFEHKESQPAVAAPPTRSLASLDTHDTPTFGAFVSGADIELRRSLGLLKSSQTKAERLRRNALLKAFAIQLRKERLLENGAPNSTALLKATLRHLARSRADFVLFSLEDLWLEIDPQNVPGTTDQHPNWQRKTRLSIEELTQSSGIRELLAAVRTERRTKGSGSKRSGRAKQ